MPPNPRTYRVVALSMPTVYTIDGDHDPNGMLYAVEAHRPLLEYARDRLTADDEWLPRTHLRLRLARMLVDGLARYEAMLGVLRTDLAGHPLAATLLAYRGPRDSDELDAAGIDVRRDEVVHHLTTTVDEIAGALRELTDGAVTEVPRDEAARALLRTRWTSAAEGLRLAIEAQLAKDDEAWLRTERARLIDESGLPGHRVDRLMRNDHTHAPDELSAALAQDPAHPYDRVNPLRPLPVVRPLVLRARRGETVEVTVTNALRARTIGFARQGALDVTSQEGSHVGRNDDHRLPPGGEDTITWTALEEGVWPIHDLADVRGTELGSNVHGLFAALIVEPEHARWLDPETGDDLTDETWGDGLDVDIVFHDEDLAAGGVSRADDAFVDFATDGARVRDHREFTVIIHDEPEVHGPFHGLEAGDHSVMPIAYRAEPMPNRLPHRMREYARLTTEHGHAGRAGEHSPGPHELRAVRAEIDRQTLAETFWTGRREDGTWIERVAGEEQHHSSWLFGEPVTSVLRAYRGDPCRVRLIHAGVKETHVFHLHVHQWRAVAPDTAAPGSVPADGSHLLDSITIGPQTAHTVDPLYGSGSRQHAVGDVIWHCHLYPHFHHGMWGLWRSLDRLVDGSRAYPDGTPCRPLRPLPRRVGDDVPAPDDRPGFPWFVDAVVPQKAPPPPVPDEALVAGRRALLELGPASDTEQAAFVPGARPGELFVDLARQAAGWLAGTPGPRRTIGYDVEVRTERLVYNELGWYDPAGHSYRVVGAHVSDDDGATWTPQDLPPPAAAANREPLWIRANHGDIVELHLHNELTTYPSDGFDLAQLPVECGLHVHLVKFDVLAADGSSTGWNYLSGASTREAVAAAAGPGNPGNVSVHRWVVDEEFGPCFFHDHLLANFRQKHGLYAALIAEPAGSTWVAAASENEETAWTGREAIVSAGAEAPFDAFREACLGLGDFVPLHDRRGRPLNPPPVLGGLGDHGVVGVNYRSAPLTARGPDPAQWFAVDEGRRRRLGTVLPDRVTDGPALVDGADAVLGYARDPWTPIVHAEPGERLRLRLLQGSHEEQHSLVVHGMRWRRDWHRTASPWVDQQTLGISEAFTLEVDQGFGVGDHLYRFSAMDDLWLGAWGVIRVVPRGTLPRHASVDEDRALPRRRKVADRAYVVRARRVRQRYAGEALVDPWGLVLETAAGVRAAYREDPEVEPPTLDEAEVAEHRWLLAVEPDVTDEPLVLRATAGEWVRIRLVNEVRLPSADREYGVEIPDRREDPGLPTYGPEPHPPRLPEDDVRVVGERVSLHPSLLSYDVVDDDGAFVGTNHDSTVGPLPVPGDHGAMAAAVHPGHDGRGNWRDFWWYADPALLVRDAAGREGPRVCYLHDMADVRNHRHHGLVGALVVEPEGWEPASWTGRQTTLIRDDGVVVDEEVLFWQDGLRLYLQGNPDWPLADATPDVDPTDAGTKGVSSRCALPPVDDPLADEAPVTPLLRGHVDRPLWLHLVDAGDKPRNHVVTVHGLSISSAPWVEGAERIGAIGGLSVGTTHDLELLPRHAGDHAYRSGAFRWAVQQGMWGILHVE